MRFVVILRVCARWRGDVTLTNKKGSPAFTGLPTVAYEKLKIPSAEMRFCSFSRQSYRLRSMALRTPVR